MPPRRTPEDRAAIAARARRNIAKASEIRSNMAQLKRELGRGKVDAVALMRGDLDEWEPTAQRLKLDVLLAAIRGFGPVTVREFLHETRLPGDTKLLALTFAKRAEMADLVYLMLNGVPAQEAAPTSPYAPPSL